MLAPPVPKTRKTLAEAYAGFLALDSLTTAIRRLVIQPRDPEPPWLADVRREVAVLTGDATRWLDERPAIVGTMLSTVQGYAATVDAVAEHGLDLRTDGAQAWADLLEGSLLAEAAVGTTALEDADGRLRTQLATLRTCLPSIDASLEQAWSALDGEEQAMLDLTRALQSLDDQVAALASQMSDAVVGGSQDCYTSSVETLYDLGEAGAEAEVPVLGVVTVVFTEGKTFYDLATEDDQLIAALDQVVEVTSRLSAAALGVALTKSTLQTLYALERRLLSVGDGLTRVADLWASQRETVQDAVEALRAGADPAQLLDLATLPAARAAWQEIGSAVDRLARTDGTVAIPVTIDVAARTIH